MLGSTGLDLIRELQRTHVVPPYNVRPRRRPLRARMLRLALQEDALRTTVEEMLQLDRSVMVGASERLFVSAPTWCGNPRRRCSIASSTQRTRSGPKWCGTSPLRRSSC